MEKTPQQVVRNCDNNLTPEAVFSSFIEALEKGVSEVNFIVTTGERSHFTSCNIELFYEMLKKSAGEFAQTFNDQVHATVGTKPRKEVS